MKRTNVFLLLLFSFSLPLITSAQWGRIASRSPDTPIAFTGLNQGFELASDGQGNVNSRGSWVGDHYIHVSQTSDNWQSTQHVKSIYNGFYTFTCTVNDIQCLDSANCVMINGSSNYSYGVDATHDGWETHFTLLGGNGSIYFNSLIGGDVDTLYHLTLAWIDHPDSSQTGYAARLIKSSFGEGVGYPVVWGRFSAGDIGVPDSESPVVVLAEDPGDGVILKLDPVTNVWNEVYRSADWQFGDEGHNRRIIFLDEQVGYVTGPNGQLLETRDGGNTWTAIQTPLSGPLTTLEFVDPALWFIGSGEGVILKTTDAGGTWEEQFLYHSTEAEVMQIKAFNEEEGYAFLSNGDILQLGAGAGHVDPFENPEESNYFLINPSLIESAEMMDVMGRKLQETGPGNTFHMNFDGLPEGVYVIRFWVEGEPRSEKYRVWR